jgi:hypothetical protein
MSRSAPSAHLGVAQDGHVVATEVAREDHALRATVLVDVEGGDGAAEHVAGVEEGQVTPGAMVRGGGRGSRRSARGGEGVLLGVERLDGLAVDVAAVDLLVEEARVGLLDHRRVAQHRRAEVAGGVGGEDGPS